MTATDITDRRLTNQQLSATHFTQPSQLVAHFGAMQAQDYAAAKWAIGARLPGATEADIEAAIADRTIVRTWPMRGTIHFVAATDIRWMLDLLAPRMMSGLAGRRQRLGIDQPTLDRSRDIICTALSGDQQIARPQLYKLLEANGIATAEQRGIHLLQQLCLEGLLCIAAHEGRQPTFALIADWAPQAETKPRDEALTELTRRYYTSHGPATEADFAWWSGLTRTDIRWALTCLGGELVSANFEGRQYWYAAQTVAPTIGTGLHLLPAFDEFFISYRDRSAMLEVEHHEKIVPGGNGMFKPIIVSHGQIIGTWKRTDKRGRVAVVAEPFWPVESAAISRLAIAAERYAHYRGLQLELS
jgi:hypothetical protein